MRALLSLLFLAALSTGAFAGEIANGATLAVKPNSIWFHNEKQLARWQKLQKSGNAAALAAYERKALGSRDAWQFIDQLNVKVLNIEPLQHRVRVQMTTVGRLQGTEWLLDPDTLVQ